jgi:hypothetical protein
MKFWICLAICVASFCVANQAEAQCGGSSGRVARAASAPVRLFRVVRQRERVRPIRRLFGR